MGIVGNLEILGYLGAVAIKVVGHIVVFLTQHTPADEIAIAMEARGYDGGEGRTRRKPLVWKFNDTLAILTAILMTGILFL